MTVPREKGGGEGMEYKTFYTEEEEEEVLPGFQHTGKSLDPELYKVGKKRALTQLLPCCLIMWVKKKGFHQSVL